MSEESPESLERITREHVRSKQISEPISRAQGWHLGLVCVLPTILLIALGGMISVVQRLPWVARLQIDGDWLVLGYCITNALSTFLLGFVHSRIYNALHPENIPKRIGERWWHAIKFFLLQLLLIPLIITLLAALCAVVF